MELYQSDRLVKLSPSDAKVKLELTSALTVIVHAPRGGCADNCNELPITPVKCHQIATNGIRPTFKL